MQVVKPQASEETCPLEEIQQMKKHNVAGAILFCGFLFLIAAGYLLPKSDFSEMEKRYLAEKPVFRWETVFSGDWSSQAEDYLSDHVPGRNFFVGLNAYMELLAGRQQLKDVWLVDEKLVEAPVAADEATISRNMYAINKLAEITICDIRSGKTAVAGRKDIEKLTCQLI